MSINISKPEFHPGLRKNAIFNLQERAYFRLERHGTVGKMPAIALR